MKILVAPDKFKGTLSARAVARAIAAAFKKDEVTLLPLADGGEGTLKALSERFRTVEVLGPGLVPVKARIGLTASGEAIVESAQACGLSLARRLGYSQPMKASTYGVGQLIRAAASLKGVWRIVVGVGGTASTDGGLGALLALSAVKRGGLKLDKPLLIAADSNIFFTQAARLFAPQKGASPEQVVALERRLKSLRAIYERLFGRDPEVRYGGAGGGLAGALFSGLDGSLLSGASLIGELKGLPGLLKRSDLVITAEGQFDETSLTGKVTGYVIKTALKLGKPVVVLSAASPAAQVPGAIVVDLSRHAAAKTVTASDLTRIVRELSSSLKCQSRSTSTTPPPRI